MNIHEYQAKKLFSENHISTPKGILVTSVEEAEKAFEKLGGGICAVKAQIHAGGRGKAGGVKIVKTSKDCIEETKKLLGSTLVTHQTGPQGKKVRKVYVEEGTQICKEYYLSCLVDRESANITLMFSKEGGMDIEEVAAKTPEKIFTLSVDTTIGLKDYQLRQLIFDSKVPQEETKNFTGFVKSLYKLFLKHDFSMIEINPLIVTNENKIMPLDGKMSFDENSLYRHPNIKALRDFEEEDPREVEASEHGLSYIGLDGNIGCLVNGAGLAMATMDIIKHYGGEPANFLDVGGGASEDMVKNAFKIILRDKKVKAVFVNIFGGIMRCDVIARGIVTASQELKISIPLVVRLEGTNVQQGKQILHESGLSILPADYMSDGAEKAVQAARG